MESLLSACIDPFLGLLRDQVLKHLCFAVQVGRNVESLVREAEKLEAKRRDVSERIQADEPMGKKPTHEVEAWLRDAEAVHQRARSIRCDYDSRSCTFNCFSNHHIGRRAAEELSNAGKALRNLAEVKEVTAAVLPPPAQAMPTTAITDAGGSEIRRNLRAALDFLRDDAQGSLGVWGMGGVGKTTLLEHVNDSLAKDPSSSGFDRVVFLVASRDCTVEKIQELLLKKLGLTDSAQIFSYLSSKSFVLLLDDLWDPLDLKRAGVPLPFGAVGQFKRKLILTTRFQQVCRNMDVRAIIEVRCLIPDGARRLFRDKVGEDAISSHPLIPRLADEVADECDGLPLALITIGRAMAGNRTVQVWQNAVRLLRESKLSKIPGMVDPLPLLKFSYDHLKDPTEQQCFLYCALWREDYRIRKEKLIECWMGHGLLGDDVDEIDDVYNQGHAIIDSLQKACLLEPVEPDARSMNSERVKLHDVIRDMALWIARDCGKNENKWVVLERGKVPHDARVWSEVHIMSASRYSIKGFPSGIQSCPKLVTLSLHSDARDLRHFEDGVSNDLHDFLQAFFAEHPEYAENDFYVTGESYAGHYIPALASRVHRGNKAKDGIHINLKGFAIGNGLTDPKIQYKAYTDYALDNGIIKRADYERINKFMPRCDLAIKRCGASGNKTCKDAFGACQLIVGAIIVLAGNINYYDIRKQCKGSLCYDFSNMERFLNDRSVRESIGVGNVTFVPCSDSVHAAMLSDWMRDLEVGIPALLEDGIKVLVYAGEYDLLCNWLGNSRWVHAMEWSGKHEFASRPELPFEVDGKEAGVMKSYGPLSFLKV